MHGFVCLCEILEVLKLILKFLEKSLKVEKALKEFKLLKV
jgi:hypothetical protein